MITFKTLTKEELKKDYSDRLGFVFRGPVKSSDRAIEHLCDILIKHSITKEYPDFVVRLDDLTTAFVYKDSFSGPTFFQHATIAVQIGVCNIDSIFNYCKQI